MHSCLKCIINKMNLCPSPEHPIVMPDREGLKLRKWLYILYIGEMGVCICRMLIFGAFSGIFQLINVWIIYSSYATLHFCSCFMYSLLCLLEVLFISQEWKRATNPRSYKDTHGASLDYPPDSKTLPSGTEPAPTSPQDEAISPLLYLLFGYILIYNIIAVIYSWKSFKHFQWLFNTQHGGELPDDDAFINNDEEAQY